MTDLNARRDAERRKYLALAAHRPRYFNRNHGDKATDWLIDQKPLSVLDVGCGNGQFVRDLRAAGIKAVGLDFASPDADIHRPAHDTGCLSQEFEWVTAFDVLEHLLPDEVDEVLAEFRRVSSRFMFSIASFSSRGGVKGEELHQTVKPEEWWVDKLGGPERVSFVGNAKWPGRYMWGSW